MLSTPVRTRFIAIEVQFHCKRYRGSWVLLGARAVVPCAVWHGRGALDLDLLWRAYVSHFDSEHSFHFLKQVLGWTNYPAGVAPRTNRSLVLAGASRVHTVALSTQCNWPATSHGSDAASGDPCCLTALSVLLLMLVAANASKPCEPSPAWFLDVRKAVRPTRLVSAQSPTGAVATLRCYYQSTVPGRFKFSGPEQLGPESAWDLQFMRHALEEAARAAEMGEVPVGAVVVRGEEILAAAHNEREATQDPTAHAELLAIRRAAARTGSWRLTGCTLYTTLEPCPMCAGALHASRVSRLVYAAPDPKSGAAGTLYDLPTDPRLNHTYPYTSGILQSEAAALLQAFFEQRRRKQ